MALEQVQIISTPDAIQEFINNSVSEAFRRFALSNIPTGPPPDQVFTIKQAAEFLSLSVPTIYRLVQSATVPVSKQGKRLYFSKMDLTEWIKTGRKKTAAEISNNAGSFLVNKKKGAKSL